MSIENEGRPDGGATRAGAMRLTPNAFWLFVPLVEELYRRVPASARPWSITWAITTVFSTIVVGLIDGWTWRVLSWSVEMVGIGQGLAALLTKVKPRIAQPIYQFLATVFYVGAPSGLCIGVMSPFLYDVKQPAAVAGYYGLAFGVFAVTYWITAVTLVLSLLAGIAHVVHRVLRRGAAVPQLKDQLLQQTMPFYNEHLECFAGRFLPRLRQSADESMRLMRHTDPEIRSCAIIASFALWRMGDDPQFIQSCCNIVIQDADIRPRSSALYVLTLTFLFSPSRDLLRIFAAVVKDGWAPIGRRNDVYRIIRRYHSATSIESDPVAYIGELQAEMAEFKAEMAAREAMAAGEAEQLLDIDWELIERILDGRE